MHLKRAARRAIPLALACVAAFHLAAATPAPLRWFYPMDRIAARSTVKPFGILVDDAFYVGREKLFPSRFKGIHSGHDLETFPNEKTDAALVPVYAVSSGVISFKGALSGYGGVLLLRLDDGEHVALYGHVKLPTDLSVGDRVVAGSRLAFLGDDFSAETAGERKHLHFGIHKGTDNYFHGHEAATAILRAEWEDPLPFLASRGAIDPR